MPATYFGYQLCGLPACLSLESTALWSRIMYLAQPMPEMLAPLEQASKQLRATVAAAHSLWQSDCVRIGWAPQQSVAPSTPADNHPTWFEYFCARMRIRHQVRCEPA